VEENNKRIPFRLRYDQLYQWRDYCKKFEEDFGLPHNILTDTVLSELENLKYPDDIINGYRFEAGGSDIYSYSAVHSLFKSIADSTSENSGEKLTEHIEYDSLHNRLVFTTGRSAFRPSSPNVDFQQLLLDHLGGGGMEAGASIGFDASTPMPMPPPHPNNGFHNSLSLARSLSKQRFLIYQSKGAFTGGTVALQLLQRQFQKAGVECVLCDSLNEDDSRCSHPSGMQCTYVFYVFA
jgi:hypothetical protein